MLQEKKKDLKFNLKKFSNLIAKNSSTQVIIVKSQLELINFLKKKFDK